MNKDRNQKRLNLLRRKHCLVKPLLTEVEAEELARLQAESAEELALKHPMPAVSILESVMDE